MVCLKHLVSVIMDNPLVRKEEDGQMSIDKNLHDYQWGAEMWWLAVLSAALSHGI